MEDGERAYGARELWRLMTRRFRYFILHTFVLLRHRHIGTPARTPVPLTYRGSPHSGARELWRVARGSPVSNLSTRVAEEIVVPSKTRCAGPKTKKGQDGPAAGARYVVVRGAWP